MTSLPTIYGMMVTKNEEGRYLEEMLAHANETVDMMFVYDDRSDDKTAHICREMGAATVVRGQEEPSFAVNEGQFRQNAWQYFQQLVSPVEGSWVLALDADEFPVSPFTDLIPHDAVRRAVADAIFDNAVSALIQFREVWQHEPIAYRIDGFWDGIIHPRLFKYIDDDRWAHAKLGGGSVPDYVRELTAVSTKELNILHYGYADPADRMIKYQRYCAHPGNHNMKHIQSILGNPTLVEWTGGRP